VKTVHCSKCKAVCVPTGCTTGYGYTASGRKLCFACCAERDKADMVRTGRTTLYLTHEMRPENPTAKHGTVGNWPGSLVFHATVKKGRHNIASTRYDVWFVGPDGRDWHGVQYGENTQLCHCKRVA
jgi:hypothetical protein